MVYDPWKKEKTNMGLKSRQNNNKIKQIKKRQKKLLIEKNI